MVILISSRAAALTKRLRAQAQATKYARYLDDTYTLYEIIRPAGTWDAGEEDEQYTIVGNGRCKVYALGAGGPRMRDMIYPASPYRIRVLASDFIDADGGVPDLTNRIIVTGGARVFRIDDLKVEDADDLLADLYVTERPGADIPAEA